MKQEILSVIWRKHKEVFPISHNHPKRNQSRSPNQSLVIKKKMSSFVFCSFVTYAFLAEQLKDWKSPVPPANVPAYRALYTGYKTRSRSAQQSTSYLSLLEATVEEQSHHEEDDSDFDENETFGHRHASETQRVVWTRQEELILEHEVIYFFYIPHFFD